MSKKIIQTAGRADLGDFAPAFAHFNDDVLYRPLYCQIMQADSKQKGSAGMKN